MNRAALAIKDVRYRPPHTQPLGFEPIQLDTLRRRARSGTLGSFERLDFHVLLFADASWTQHEVDFANIRLGPDHVVHGAPGQVQRFSIGPRSRGILLAIRPDFLPSDNPLDREPATRYRLPDRRTRHWLDDLVRLYGEAPRPTETMTHLLFALLARLVPDDPSRTVAASNAARALHRAFVALVERSFAEHRDVAHYARRLGYAERTLARACIDVEGRGPKAIVDGRVVIEAKRLLAYTTQRVSQLAYVLGFSEVTNFVKFFQHRTGETPLAFRRACFPAKRPVESRGERA